MTVFMYPAMSALIHTDFSYCICRIPRWCPVFWYNLTWTSFCGVLYKKSMTPQHSSLCLQVKALTHLTLLPRNQSDNSNTLLHFSASHLFFLSSASPFLSASPLICLHPSPPRLLRMLLTPFAKSLRAGMISLDTFIIRNSRGSGASVPRRCLLLILSRVSG